MYRILDSLYFAESVEKIWKKNGTNISLERKSERKVNLALSLASHFEIISTRFIKIHDSYVTPRFENGQKFFTSEIILIYNSTIGFRR